MLRELLQRGRELRAAAAATAAANAELAAKVALRESQLAEEVERLRAKDADDVAAMLPLLVEKQRRLEKLEVECCDKGLHHRLSINR